MIVRVVAQTIARTAPVARVRRRDSRWTDEATVGDGGEGETSFARPAAPFDAVGGGRAMRGAGARLSPAFRAALMALHRGG